MISRTLQTPTAERGQNWSLNFAVGLRVAFIVLMVALQTSCLETRQSVKETEEKQVLEKQVKTLQVSTADVSERFQQIDEDIRKLNGRVDVSESRLVQTMGKNEKASGNVDARIKDLSDKLAIYQESASKLEAQMAALSQQVAQLDETMHKASASSSSTSSGKAEGGKGGLAVADELFAKKQFQEAALDYEKYRKNNPKGKYLAVATYRIGVCFQELGSADDAKEFFKEVLAKYPKSPEATKATGRLKSLADKSK